MVFMLMRPQDSTREPEEFPYTLFICSSHLGDSFWIELIKIQRLILIGSSSTDNVHTMQHTITQPSSFIKSAKAKLWLTISQTIKLYF